MSKALKVLGVIGIILASLGLICCCATDPYGYSSGFIAWLLINSSFLMAISIVAIVQYSKHKTK